MNLKLIRKSAGIYGVFGELYTEQGQLLAVTLEHSYDGVPKLPAGTYDCQRGVHRLEKMPAAFETFEITGVPGHTDILFHSGNYNKDSEGCVLLGSYVGTGCILDSRIAFEKFMSAQAGLDSFTLIVE